MSSIFFYGTVEENTKINVKQEEDEDMSEAKRARMGEAAPLMWDQFAEENKEDDFFFTGEQ
jgi:hypothetical protein